MVYPLSNLKYLDGFLFINNLFAWGLKIIQQWTIKFLIILCYRILGYLFLLLKYWNNDKQILKSTTDFIISGSWIFLSVLFSSYIRVVTQFL